MIMPEFAEKLAKEYCLKNGILIVNGRVPDEHISDIQNYVNLGLEAARRKTRNQEREMALIITPNDIFKSLNLKSDYESPLEEFMALGLMRNGLMKYFKPQLEIGKYRVDLACEEAMLIVECDGHKYHFTEKSQIERDQKRDKYLSRRGWRILHFEGIAIRRNMDFCIEKLKEALGTYLEVAA